ncbi:MAG: hypothetical protein CMH59_20590 [Myxococcales bacterium]|nr:hypothetical protein [Myxococcales bacterium]
MSPENERIGPVELRVSDESVEVVRLETPGRRLREHAHLVALPLAALWWGLSRPESVPSGLLFLLTVVVALPEMARQGIAFLGALGPGGLPIRRSLRIERLASSDGGYRTADAGRSRVLLDGAPLDAGRPLRIVRFLHPWHTLVVVFEGEAVSLGGRDVQGHTLRIAERLAHALGPEVELEPPRERAPIALSTFLAVPPLVGLGMALDFAVALGPILCASREVAFVVAGLVAGAFLLAGFRAAGAAAVRRAARWGDDELRARVGLGAPGEARFGSLRLVEGSGELTLFRAPPSPWRFVGLGFLCLALVGALLRPAWEPAWIVCTFTGGVLEWFLGLLRNRVDPPNVVRVRRVLRVRRGPGDGEAQVSVDGEPLPDSSVRGLQLECPRGAGASWCELFFVLAARVVRIEGLGEAGEGERLQRRLAAALGGGEIRPVRSPSNGAGCAVGLLGFGIALSGLALVVVGVHLAEAGMALGILAFIVAQQLHHLVSRGLAWLVAQGQAAGVRERFGLD